jgi:hypothetical protein
MLNRHGRKANKNVMAPEKFPTGQNAVQMSLGWIFGRYFGSNYVLEHHPFDAIYSRL